jgi:radical SAM protein with 4Fe4S-binding SPASM domain
MTAAGTPLPRPYRQKRTAAALISARVGASGAPFSAMVEIADRCNEACVHCYQVQGQKGELGTAEWEQIFRELAELGVMFLTISGGEPTLRKDFLHLVAYARRLRFAVKIFSNGLLITPALARELGELAVQEVQLSLYSHEPALHDAITRVPGSFERLVAAVRALRAENVKVVLKSPLMLANAPGFAAYVDFVVALGADYSLDPKLNPRENGDMAPTELSVGKQAYLAVRRDARFAATRPPRERPLDSPPCGACTGNVHIEPNGELRPCTQWSLPTGQAQAGLREAWYENAVARRVRELTWNDLQACKRCDLRPYCQRCFAEAEHHTGDALAPYARACRSARWKYEAELGVEPELDSESGSCSAAPLGPFRQVGEHRFVVEARADVEPAAAPVPTSAGRAAPGSVPGAQRVWLGAAAPSALVPLRRRADGPAVGPRGASAPARVDSLGAGASSRVDSATFIGLSAAPSVREG